MPKRKASKARKEASKKAHEARGSGSKSRISLDFEKLKNAGWTIEENHVLSHIHFAQRFYQNTVHREQFHESTKRSLCADAPLPQKK